MTHPIPERAKFALIGVIFHPRNTEMPWLVQDSRKAVRNKFPCRNKAEALDKIAAVLDDMSETADQSV